MKSLPNIKPIVKPKPGFESIYCPIKIKIKHIKQYVPNLEISNLKIFLIINEIMIILKKPD